MNSVGTTVSVGAGIADDVLSLLTASFRAYCAGPVMGCLNTGCVSSTHLANHRYVLLASRLGNYPGNFLSLSTTNSITTCLPLALTATRLFTLPFAVPYLLVPISKT